MDLRFYPDLTTKLTIDCLSPDFVPLAIDDSNGEILWRVSHRRVEMLLVVPWTAMKITSPAERRHKFLMNLNRLYNAFIPASLHIWIGCFVAIQQELAHSFQCEILRQLQRDLGLRYFLRTHSVQHHSSTHVVIGAVVSTLGQITQSFVNGLTH